MQENNHLRLPWRLAPLEGKYYGTDIVDVTGERIARLWLKGDTADERRPSQREDIAEGDIYDDHYENQRTYITAWLIVTAANGAAHGVVIQAEQA